MKEVSGKIQELLGFVKKRPFPPTPNPTKKVHCGTTAVSPSILRENLAVMKGTFVRVAASLMGRPFFVYNGLVW